MKYQIMFKFIAEHNKKTPDNREISGEGRIYQ